MDSFPTPTSSKLALKMTSLICAVVSFLSLAVERLATGIGSVLMSASDGIVDMVDGHLRLQIGDLRPP